MSWHFVFLRFFLTIFWPGGGGKIEVAICDWADKLDRTAWSPTSTTPQSTSAHSGRGWKGRGMAWRHCFIRGVWTIILSGGGGRIEVAAHRLVADLDHTTIN